MKYFYHFLSFGILVILCSIQTVNAQTTVADTLSSDVTWTVANSPYQLTDTVIVAQGVTLTIEAGVTVQLDLATSLIIDGAIVADGSFGNEITFTSSSGSPAAGDWGTIRFNNTSGVGSVFDYVILEYGGGAGSGAMVTYRTGAFAFDITNAIFRNSAGHGIDLRASSPLIQNSEFRNNIGYGIFSDLALSFEVDNSVVAGNTTGGIRAPINSSPNIHDSRIDSNGIGIYIDNGAIPDIENNIIDGNNYGIVIIEAAGQSPKITDNTIRNSATLGIDNRGTGLVTAEYNFWGDKSGPTNALNPTGIGDAVSNNIDFTPWLYGVTLPVREITSNPLNGDVWSADSVYWVKNNITLGTGQTLTIQPGAVIKFADNVDFFVYGTLIADGTENDKIFFTSQYDDAIGGDSNGDGRTTQPNRGNWRRIYLYDQSVNNVFDYVDIRYGGYSSSGNLYIDEPTTSVTNTFVTNSNSYGFNINKKPISFNSNTANNNTYTGFYLNNQSSELKNLTAQYNNDHGLAVNLSGIDDTVSVIGGEFSNNDDNGIVFFGSGNFSVDSLVNITANNNRLAGIDIYQNGQDNLIADNLILNNNGTYGASFYLDHKLKSDFVIRNSEFKGNKEAGLRTTSSQIYGNTFEDNEFGVTLWGPLGHIYEDDSGNDGNTFTNNKFNNVIGIEGRSLQDTLSTNFPEAVTSGVYMYMWFSGSYAVDANDTLTIDPGVILKLGHKNANTTNERKDFKDFDVRNGLLIAEGTEENPIIFTSWRDDTVGGDTDAVDDTVSAKAYDWDQLFIQLTNNSLYNTEDSRLSHIELKYGGDGALRMQINDATFTNPIDYVKVSDSYYHGMYLGYGKYTITNSEVKNTRIYNGIYSRYNADLTVRNSNISSNANYGIYTEGHNNSFIRELSNSTISNNGLDGVRNPNLKSASTLLGNTVNNNGGNGIYIWHNQLDSTDVFFTGNTIEGNSESGIVSSAANFVDNQFNNNEFGITFTGKLGHRFTDENGVDGNTFTGNTFNNVLGLFGHNLKGKLSTNMPEDVTSDAYMFMWYSGAYAVSTGDTLEIEPGVIVKMGYKNANTTNERKDFKDFHVRDGLLIAEGTEENPIIFTSWRDDTAGGDTDAADDTVSAKPYDWDQLYIQLTNKSAYNTEESRLSHLKLRFGGDGALRMQMNDATFSNPLNQIEVSDAYYHGMYLGYGKFTITNSEVKNTQNNNGIFARYNADLTVRKSIITSNNQYGIYLDGRYSFLRELSGSMLLNNGYEGVYSVNQKSPSTIQNNRISNNSRSGMYLTIDRTVDTDTVLTISGNIFENNDGPGFVSSRAIIVDDTLRGNKYPFGVTGELSKSGTVNVLGNYYEGNVIENNEFDSLYTVRGTVNGVLGGTFPQGYMNKLILKEQINENIQVNSGDSLIIKPGVIIKNPIDSRYGLNVHGTLLVEGTEDEKVVFTSLRDDTYAGNTNNDTTGVQPDRNNWGGIDINGQPTDSSRINNLIVRYASEGLLLNDTDVVVDSSIFSFNTNGVIVQSNAEPTFRHSDFHNNFTGMNVRYSNAKPLIQLSNFYSNRDNAIYQASSTNIMAENNYWGDPSGPFVNNGPDQNVNGQADRINVASGTVDYRPYLVGRNGILLGDVTINGTISAFDASKILLHVVGLDILTGNNLAAGDVTGNGTVSSMDASLVLQYVVGIITGFPGQGKIVAHEPQNMLALDYEDSDTFTDITYNHKGGFGFYGAEMELILPVGTVDRVEWTNSAFSDHIELNYNQIGDTLRIAMASAKPIRKSGDLGDIRLIYSDESTASSVSEQIKYHKFAANEVDLTEFVNENFTTSENEALIPEEFALNQNYPNPFNPSTNISYQLPADAKVQVQVYNMLGQLVQTLVDDNQKAGVYNLRWDASTFSSGTYLLRIDVVGSDNQNYSQIRKMLLIK